MKKIIHASVSFRIETDKDDLPLAYQKLDEMISNALCEAGVNAEWSIDDIVLEDENGSVERLSELTDGGYTLTNK